MRPLTTLTSSARSDRMLSRQFFPFPVLLAFEAAESSPVNAAIPEARVGSVQGDSSQPVML